MPLFSTIFHGRIRVKAGALLKDLIHGTELPIPLERGEWETDGWYRAIHQEYWNCWWIEHEGHLCRVDKEWVAEIVRVDGAERRPKELAQKWKDTYLPPGR